MFEMFMNKDYLVIVLVALTAFVLSYMNPASLQNKRYHHDGDSCPNPSYYGLILLAVGTGLYYLVHNMKC